MKSQAVGKVAEPAPSCLNAEASIWVMHDSSEHSDPCKPVGNYFTFQSPYYKPPKSCLCRARRKCPGSDGLQVPHCAHSDCEHLLHSCPPTVHRGLQQH